MLTKETKEIQQQVASYCRSGENSEIKGITPNRLHHYHRLIHSILKDALESAYPIAFHFLDSATWNELVKAFIEKHNCQHPQLFLMPGEFIEFIEKEEIDTEKEYPFLLDLLRFEWLEVIVHTQKDEIIPNLAPAANLLENRLFFTPYLSLLQTDYPVHKLNEIDIAQFPGSYFYLVYREENGTVQYLELNSFSFSLLQETRNQSISVNQLLKPLFEEADFETQQVLKEQTYTFLQNLLDLGLILGEIPG